MVAIKLPEGDPTLPPDPVAVELCTLATDGTVTAGPAVTAGARTVVAAINAGPEYVQGKTPCNDIADDHNVYIWTFVYKRRGKFQLEHAFGYPQDCNYIAINTAARVASSDALAAYRKLT